MQPRTARRTGLAIGCALASALAFALVLALPAHAQVADGAIEVVAVDAAGDSLPGVSVEVKNTATGLTRQGFTNEAGVARVLALPPGSYHVTATLSGFSPVAAEDLGLRVGQTVRVTITMEMAVTEQLTVTGAAGIVDVYRADASTNIVPEEIDDLPIADRDFQKLAFIAPGVQRERGGFRFIGGGPVVGGSGNASQATVLVDGVDLTDPSLGLARARFSSDAIAEFKVLTNRFDIEVGGSAGGALSIVTKSGTNDFGGRVFGFYRDDALREKGELEQQKNPYGRDQYGFALGGPIVLDRTHWFLSYEHVAEDAVTLFRPSGAFAGLARDIDRPFDQDLLFGSLDQILSTSQRLSAKVVWETYEEENFRVGGVVAEAAGQTLERDNANLTLAHDWTLGNRSVNSARFQYGQREYDEPTNTDAVAEWFSSGTTLQTGANIVGDLFGEDTQYELKDTFYTAFDTGAVTHDVKAGLGYMHLEDRFDLPTFQNGLMIYVTDTRVLPLAYSFGVGSADATIETDIYSAFVQDDIRLAPNVTISAGVRYDLDTEGNNPDFTHPLRPTARGRDDDNIQPRLGFTWDVKGDGAHLVRGGAGIFTGRFLLVPAFTELQQNGITGRRLFSRLNGALLGLPRPFWLDPNNPTTTGIPLPQDITLLDSELEAPESTQANLGYTVRLGDTGLYLETDAIYAEGDNEIVIRDTNFGGNANPVRLDRRYNQINTYTNEGHSEYKALVLGVSGTIFQKHLVRGSVTLGDKKNISDDFSPDFPTGYPNDPANIEGEWGPSRGDERYRVVLSGVFRLPWQMAIAPIWEYGSGQPWTERLGYDFNGDGKNSDRPAGVGRNDEDGPSFNQLSLRVSKMFPIAAFGDQRGGVEVIAEVFNLLDTTNYNVQSINSGRYLTGPTLSNPNAAYVANPRFGKYSSTFSPREFQLGVRVEF